jgi:hypothetical protein
MRRERRSKVKRRVVHKRGKLKPIPPTEAAARDEGPRLIPLDDRSKEPSRLEHYLDLADTALGLKRSQR